MSVNADTRWRNFVTEWWWALFALPTLQEIQEGLKKVIESVHYPPDHPLINRLEELDSIINTRQTSTEIMSTATNNPTVIIKP